MRIQFGDEIQLYAKVTRHEHESTIRAVTVDDKEHLIECFSVDKAAKMFRNLLMNGYADASECNFATKNR